MDTWSSSAMNAMVNRECGTNPLIDQHQYWVYSIYEFLVALNLVSAHWRVDRLRVLGCGDHNYKNQLN